jgi:DNA-binding SARP family transcriptional activator/tetratricopeptide (TPR) repeat protein
LPQPETGVTVQFRILGQLEVVERGAAQPLGGAKQRAVLAILLLHRGELVSGDRLAEELWGERPPATAVKTLQGYVSRLRKAVGEAALSTRGHGYVLTLRFGQLDLDQFEELAAEGRDALSAGNAGTAADRLRAALALWRGPPLADFTYEPFAQAEIARLEEARSATLEDRIEADLGLGRHGELVGELERLVREHPARERLRGQLMLSLYRSGRQADALECYRTGRRTMLDELGIEPCRALQELEAAILRQDAVLDAPIDAVVSIGAVSTDGRSDRRERNAAFLRDAVIGRAEQLRQLRSGLDAILTDREVVFMIGGEAGMGKSRLADELARDARDRGARVVWGRCWEAGGAPAYWPWVQVLRSLLDRHGSVDLRAFGGAGGSSLLALISGQPAASVAPVAPAAEPEAARFRLFDAAAWVLRQAATTQPVVIVLDDLHAADTPSLLLFQFLGGQLVDAPVMLAGLYRDDDLSENGALSACLAALAREQATQRIRLTGLAAVETAAVIESITGRQVPEPVARAIHDETEGNPLFVGEIVRLLEAEGTLEQFLSEPRPSRQLPDTVREVIEQRLRRLTTTCRSLLEIACTLGREFSLKELAAVAGLDEASVLEPFDEAMTARVLADVPGVGRLRFSHALVRDTLYETLGAARRRATHLRAAESLERLHASDPEPYLAELAHHFFQALPGADPARAVEYAERAGDRAGALLAYEEAARLYDLALRALDGQAGNVSEKRCGLLASLGDAWARAGDEPAARAAFLEAAAIAANAALPELLAKAALGYGGRHVWSRAYGDVHLIRLLESALQALPAGASALRVRVMARLSGALRDQPSRERRASLSSQAVEIARELEDPATLAYALDGHYCALLWPETSEQRLAIAHEIVALADQVGDNERRAAGHLYRAIANLDLGRVTEAEQELDIMVELAQRLRQPAQLWTAASCCANFALFQGRFDDARMLVEEALALGEPAQRRDAMVSHRLQVFVLSRETGDNPGIEALIDEAVSAFPMRPVFRCARAYINSQRGDTSRAGSEVDDLAAGDFAAIQRDNEYLFSLAFVADAIEALANVRAAAVLYDLLVPYAHLNASNADEVAIGSVSRTLGVLASVLSRWDDGARHFEAAASHNRRMGARPWLAHTQHDHARMLLARGMPGDRDRARQLLAAAREQYEELGMTPWLIQASELFDAEQTTRPTITS